MELGPQFYTSGYFARLNGIWQMVKSRLTPTTDYLGLWNGLWNDNTFQPVTYLGHNAVFHNVFNSGQDCNCDFCCVFAQTARECHKVEPVAWKPAYIAMNAS